MWRSGRKSNPLMVAFSTEIEANSSLLGIAPVCRRPIVTPNLHGNRMPDALDLLKTRRSVKPIELTRPGPTASEIETLLTVASRVPDHGKLTPWRFIVFEGDARTKASKIIGDVFREKRTDATPDQIAVESARLTRAPLVIAVVSRAGPHVKIPEWEQIMSGGA